MMNTHKIIASDTNLSLQEQLELGKRASEGDAAAREKLVMSCVPLVKSFMKTPLCRHFSSGDDMFQDGMLGTVEAVDKYDYKKNIMFTTFAFYYILKRIKSGIIARSPVKVSERDFFDSVLLNSTVDTFISTHYVSPTDEQLSSLTGLSLKTIHRLQSRNVSTMVVSLNDVDAMGNSLILPEEDVCLVVERMLKESAQKQIIAEALNCLSDAEREIVLRRIMCKDPKATLKELAESQDVCITTIFNRESTAVKKLLAYFISHNVGFEDLVY